MAEKQDTAGARAHLLRGDDEFRKRQALDELRSFRPRPDDAHIAHQHVDELRELVQRGLADERAHARPPRIIFSTVSGSKKTQLLER